MGYNRHYYTHGAEPFAYQWHGRIQFPARDQSSLHGISDTAISVAGVAVPWWAVLAGGAVAAVIVSKKLKK